MKIEAFFRDILNLAKTWTLYFNHLKAKYVCKIAPRKYFKCSEGQKVHKWCFQVKTWTFVTYCHNFQNSNFDQKLKIVSPDFIEYSTDRIEISDRPTMQKFWDLQNV